MSRGEDRETIHPIVRLDFVVRLVACPISPLVVLTARLTVGAAVPVGMWILFGVYALIWPHLAHALARRSADSRAAEHRNLMADAVMAGVAMALTSFQVVPSLALVTGHVSMLASVGGPALLATGLVFVVAGALSTAALVSGIALGGPSSVLATVLAAVLLFSFQLLLGLYTYRTARGFVDSRRRITEQAEEIQAQNEALVEAREDALQAAQAKATFLATMSHEIRTPLNGVLGMTRLLAETPLSVDQRDLVRTIQGSGDTLLTVINDVLDYSRIESGRMELEQVPLAVADLVEEVLEIVAEKAHEKGLELVREIEPGVPEAILGDVTRLRQVLTNLVGNAVKFTERGEVVVRVSLLRAEAGDEPAQLGFEVRDTGIGIPEDRIRRLFAPFSQADASTTRRYGGTGLGLAISKRLAELMGGSIGVESAEGRGSSFHLTLPARKAASPLRRTRRPSGIPRGQRVLVVDDNDTNRRVLTAQLHTWGLDVAAVEGAAVALELLEAGNDFELAILDYHMPEVDGITLARRIRELEGQRKLPAILLSSSLVQGQDDPDGLFEARLLKPVRQSKLFDAVLGALGVQDAEPEAEPVASTPRPIADEAPLEILVADDNETNRRVADLVLRRFGYAPTFVVDGVEAVERVTARAVGRDGQQPFDLVFMDVQMPEMDGLEATRTIRRRAGENPGATWPRIVAMTADALQGDREIALAAGMDDYLTKPLDFEAVRSVLLRVAASIETSTPPPPSREEPLPAEDPATSEDEGIAERGIAEGGILGGRVDFDASRLEELREYDTPDGAVVRGVIDSFVGLAEGRMAEIRRAVAAQDGPGLRGAAHALRGAAANLGALGAARSAEGLERAASNGSLEDAAALLEELEVVLQGTLAVLDPRDPVDADRAGGGVE